MLIPTTNSSQIRSYRSQTSTVSRTRGYRFSQVQASAMTVVADRPQVVVDAWPCGGSRTPALAPPVGSRRLQGVPRSHHSPSLTPLPSLSPSPSRSGAPRRHCRRGLSRAHAPSSSCHAPIPSSSSTTMSSPTISTTATGRWSEGKAALADFATAPCAGPRRSRGHRGQSS
jgi:hypothetical protein